MKSEKEKMLAGELCMILLTRSCAADCRKWLESAKPIIIGSDVWVGGGTIICPGVTIGDRSVIGAGSVVTRGIPSDVFAAGNTARIIRALPPEVEEGA